MVETPLKPDEQYPLLKVDTGGGDSGGRLPATEVTPGCHVTIPKSTWRDRWPELVSVCWMTLVLLGISSLAFFSLGLITYTRQVIIVKCNNSKPASDVFYHHIVPRGNFVPFSLYSKYLSDIAQRYTSLRFNVFFLIDDTQSESMRRPRHARLFNKIMSYRSNEIYNSQIDEHNRRELRNFQRRYDNVNITVISLSKFMASTSMRCKWRNIPTSYLSFYARIYSVWQNGGIGFDLATFSNQYSNGQHFDKRIDEILKQHNDGIKTDVYINKLNKLNRDECDSNDFFKFILFYMNQFLDNTRSIFNKSNTSTQLFSEKNNIHEPLIRTHRNKRNVNDSINDSYSLTEFQYNMIPTNVTNVTFTNDIDVDKNATYDETTGQSTMNVNITSKETMLYVSDTNMSNVFGINKTEAPEVIFFIDLFVTSDSIGPPYLLSEPMRSNIVDPGRALELSGTKRSKDPPLLAIYPDGVFIAASSRLHPFLGHLISAVCQLTHPKFVIEDALLTHCAGILRDDFYCNNIYVL